MIKCFFAFFVLFLSIIIFVSYIKVKGYLNPQSPQKEKIYIDYYIKDLPLEEINLETKDNIIIKGWFAKKSKNKAVILVHGIAENRSFVNRLAKFYFEKGFSVLAIDLRNHGKSNKAKTTLGYNERLDVLSASEYLEKKGFKYIIVHGISMGAVAAIFAKKEKPSKINLVIADSPYISLEESVEYTYKNLPIFLRKPIAKITLTIGKLLTGIDISSLNIKPTVKKYKNDILIIFCEFDRYLDTKKAFYEFKNLNLNTIFFENTNHAMAFVWYPEKYFKVLEEFIRKKAKINLAIIDI